MIALEPSALKIARAKIWNGWCRTWRNDIGGAPSVITHAFEEGTEKGRTGYALCGVYLTEGGGLNLNDEEWTNGPGCKRCRHILNKRGLLPPKEETK